MCVVSCVYWIMLTIAIAVGNVWHGSQQPWHNWDILSGRFVSEFGMYVMVFFPPSLSLHVNLSRQGFPNVRTVDYWLGGDKTERFPQSRWRPVVWREIYSYRALEPTTTITKLLDLNIVWRWACYSHRPEPLTQAPKHSHIWSKISDILLKWKGIFLWTSKGVF